MDYSVYHFRAKEWIFYLCIFLIIDGCISYLFFSSWIFFLLLLPLGVLFQKEIKKELQKKREKEIKREFLDGIQMMEASLQAGYSVENSVKEALRELEKVYDQDAIIIREFRLIDTQISMSRSMEDALMDFARRSDVDDIQSFAEVFLTAKRSGGDLIAIISNTIFCIRQKQETMQEIETCLSGKVMEQRIMSVIPIAILAYVRVGSPEFIEPLYGNAAGMMIMSACFLVYLFAFFWGRRITLIEV